MVEGILVLDSTPGGATIYINGVKQPDITPGGILIAPGTYTIRLTWPGYYDWVSNVTVVATYQGQVTRIPVVMTLAVAHIQRSQRGPGMLYFVVNGVKLGATQGSADVKPGDVIGLIVELGGIGARFDKIVVTSVKAGVLAIKTYTEPTGISFIVSDEFYDVVGYFTQIPISTIIWGIIDSHPQGADIILDNKDIGQKTPATVENINAGQHSYKLRLFGYKPGTNTFLAETGKSFGTFINLVPCPPIECEHPLDGYEADGCGSRRLNPVCNPPVCTPGWQCEPDQTGYESDGCGNKRLNAACNPPACVPGWSCEPGQTGWEIDGCGNTRPNPACAAVPTTKPASKSGLYLAIGTTAFIGAVGFVAMTREK